MGATPRKEPDRVFSIWAVQFRACPGLCLSVSRARVFDTVHGSDQQLAEEFAWRPPHYFLMCRRSSKRVRRGAGRSDKRREAAHPVRSLTPDRAMRGCGKT